MPTLDTILEIAVLSLVIYAFLMALLWVITWLHSRTTDA